MANPLQSGGGLPPLPQQAQQGDGNALQAQGQMPQAQQPAVPGAPQGAPAPPPAPTHEQTVAALRHFHAIAAELQSLLKDPALGKSDLKSKIIDGTTKLVAERIISPGQAVVQLSNVPADPLEQRKWLQGLAAQNAQAANGVLDHHAAGNEGALDWAQESAAQHPHADDHMDMMTALGAQYGRR